MACRLCADRRSDIYKRSEKDRGWRFRTGLSDPPHLLQQPGEAQGVLPAVIQQRLAQTGQSRASIMSCHMY